jgi:hypothetical protein
MTNIVLEVVSHDYNPQTSRGRVVALIEDAIVVESRTYDDPSEMGPALCEAEYEIFENDEFPSDSGDLEEFFQNLNLNWHVIESDED